MPLDGFPLMNRIRFQFDEAPTAWRVRKRAEGLRGSPQTSLALHADGERSYPPDILHFRARVVVTLTDAPHPA